MHVTYYRKTKRRFTKFTYPLHAILCFMTIRHMVYAC